MVTIVSSVPENPQNRFETGGNGRGEEGGGCAHRELVQLAWLDLQLARSLRVLYLGPLPSVSRGFFTDSYVSRYARHARR